MAISSMACRGFHARRGSGRLGRALAGRLQSHSSARTILMSSRRIPRGRNPSSLPQQSNLSTVIGRVLCHPMQQIIEIVFPASNYLGKPVVPKFFRRENQHFVRPLQLLFGLHPGITTALRNRRPVVGPGHRRHRGAAQRLSRSPLPRRNVQHKFPNAVRACGTSGSPLDTHIRKQFLQTWTMPRRSVINSLQLIDDSCHLAHVQQCSVCEHGEFAPALLLPAVRLPNPLFDLAFLR